MAITHEQGRALAAKIEALYGRIPSDCGFDLPQIREYIDPGEFQLAVDDMAEVYMTLYRPLPADIYAAFDDLGTGLGMTSGYPWPALLKLLGIGGDGEGRSGGRMCALAIKGIFTGAM